MHPFSILTLGIFVAGYITARWDLVTRLYELAIFAADHGVVVSSASSILLLRIFSHSNSSQTRAAGGFALLSFVFFLLILPIERLAARETNEVNFQPCLSIANNDADFYPKHPRSAIDGISAREQLRRRGSF